jgi:23S rRNA (uridine2552-2'-O)-methyltransferase
MSRSRSSSHRWRQRQSRDPYVDRAAREGYRSRAAFKLLELDERLGLLKPGAVVVDLGAAPGGWSQVARPRVGLEGRVVALDRLPMDPIEGVELITTDFLSDEGLAMLRELVGDCSVDLVMSDLAPNMSGNRAIDQPRSMALVEGASWLAEQVLKPGGCFLTKLFQGSGQVEFERELRERFGRVRLIKPRASRPESREIYLLASDYGMV